MILLVCLSQRYFVTAVHWSLFFMYVYFVVARMWLRTTTVDDLV